VRRTAVQKENPMQVPVEITFRGLQRSDAVEAEIRRHVDALERYCDRITSCHVTLTLPHHHARQGRLFEVMIRLEVPRRELVVHRHPEAHHAHEDAHVAIRDAFKAMRRQLEDYTREIRGDVKNHVPEPHAVVSELFPLEDYGFIRTPDGRRLYFHRNSVLDGRFDELDIDSKVTFVEEAGDNGPQASTVRVCGHPFHAAGRK
jgi:ribosome-associated translation inhibitor RaiA/cold shock CspA family protein